MESTPSPFEPDVSLLWPFRTPPGDDWNEALRQVREASAFEGERRKE